MTSKKDNRPSNSHSETSRHRAAKADNTAPKGHPSVKSSQRPTTLTEELVEEDITEVNKQIPAQILAQKALIASGAAKVNKPSSSPQAPAPIAPASVASNSTAVSSRPNVPGPSPTTAPSASAPSQQAGSNQQIPKPSANVSSKSTGGNPGESATSTKPAVPAPTPPTAPRPTVPPPPPLPTGLAVPQKQAQTPVSPPKSAAASTPNPMPVKASVPPPPLRTSVVPPPMPQQTTVGSLGNSAGNTAAPVAKVQPPTATPANVKPTTAEPAPAKSAQPAVAPSTNSTVNTQAKPTPAPASVTVAKPAPAETVVPSPTVQRPSPSAPPPAPAPSPVASSPTVTQEKSKPTESATPTPAQPSNPSVAITTARKIGPYRHTRAAELDQLVVRLVRVSLFADVPAGKLIETARQIALHTFQPGQTVVEPNTEHDVAYVITEGQAQVKVPGDTHPVATLSSGDLCGEIATYFGGPHAGTVTAVTELQTLALPGPLLRTLASEVPSLREKIVQLAKKRAFSNITKIAPSLRNLPASAKTALQATWQERYCEPGTLHLLEGELPEGPVIVAAGVIDVYGGDLGSHPTVKATVGNVLGITAATSGEPSGVTARSRGPVLILALARAYFMDLAQQHLALADLAHSAGDPASGIIC